MGASWREKAKVPGRPGAACHGPTVTVGVLGSGALLLLQAVRWHGMARAAGFVAGWSPGVNELDSPGGS